MKLSDEELLGYVAFAAKLPLLALYEQWLVHRSSEQFAAEAALLFRTLPQDIAFKKIRTAPLGVVFEHGKHEYELRVVSRSRHKRPAHLSVKLIAYNAPRAH